MTVFEEERERIQGYQPGFVSREEEKEGGGRIRTESAIRLESRGVQVSEDLRDRHELWNSRGKRRVSEGEKELSGARGRRESERESGPGRGKRRLTSKYSASPSSGVGLKISGEGSFRS